MPPSPVRTFLEGVVDYAGLFPPARLDMPAAVARFAEYRASEESWLVGHFVVPISRLGDLEAVAAPHLAEEAEEGEARRGRGKGGSVAASPWRLSALAGTDFEQDAAQVLRFNSQHATGRRVDAIVDAVEARVATKEEIERVAVAFRGTGAQLYVELPLAGEVEPLIDAAAACGVRAKVRTGGTTADAFPTAGELARFLVACARVGLPLKATAGLHHALRGEYALTYDAGAPHGTMFGFLNLLFAAAFAREGLDAAALERVLEERDPSAIVFDDDGAAWRDRRLTTVALARTRREGATCIGSCSFEEPVAELRAMGLL